MLAHEVLACLELAIYVGLLLPTTFSTFHYIFKGQYGWLYLHAFVIGAYLSSADILQELIVSSKNRGPGRFHQHN